MDDELSRVIVTKGPSDHSTGPGRPQKYGKKSLSEAVHRYFGSISYDVELCGVDGQPVISNTGEPIRQTVYATPPTVAGMCLALGITRVTWEHYCDRELHPEMADVTEWARMKMLQYSNEQLLTREKPQGVIFNLQNNYGWTHSEKREVELGDKTRSAVRAGEISLDEKLAMIASASRDLAEAGYAAAETEADDSG